MEGEKDVQSVYLYNRKKLEVTGVVGVDSFDDDQITLETKMDVLIIKGKGLSMSELNLDKGKVILKGVIYSMEYSEVKDAKTKGKGILKKLLR